MGSLPLFGRTSYKFIHYNSHVISSQQFRFKSNFQVAHEKELQVRVVGCVEEMRVGMKW